MKHMQALKHRKCRSKDEEKINIKQRNAQTGNHHLVAKIVKVKSPPTDFVNKKLQKKSTRSYR